MRTATLVAAAFLAAPLAAEDKPALKEIPTKDLKLKFPEKLFELTGATEIKTAEDLAKNPVFKDSADALGKQVDFKTQKLVAFVWLGGPSEALTGELAADGKAATFTLKRDTTFERREFARLYVVPKDAEVKFVKAK